MVSLTLAAVAALSALLPTTLAQTYTDCNPLNATATCPNIPALGGNATFTFNESLYDKFWQKKNAGSVRFNDKGTFMTVSKRGESPQINSKFYIFFGRLEVVMKAAPGQGIVSSAILQSEDLDEIDWEFIGGKTNQVMTNYYGKGLNETEGRGQNFDLANVQEDFHNYTLDWTKERIQWWFDDKMIRELKFADAKGGEEYPQTPCNIRIGLWAGGDTKNNSPGTVEWAGGETDFNKGPFTMGVQYVYVQDYTSAKEYSWENMDESGDWEKVKVIEGKSAAVQEIEKPSGVKNRWNALSQTAKIAIIASVAGSFVLGLAILAFCCIRQRRRGRREFAAYTAEQDKEAAEMLAYKGSNMPGTGKMGYNRI